jgi:hypothetical protein
VPRQDILVNKKAHVIPLTFLQKIGVVDGQNLFFYYLCCTAFSGQGSAFKLWQCLSKLGNQNSIVSIEYR